MIRYFLEAVASVVIAILFALWMLVLISGAISLIIMTTSAPIHAHTLDVGPKDILIEDIIAETSQEDEKDD